MKRSLLGAVGLSVLAFAAAAHAIDRDFTVHNNIGNAVLELHVTPSSTTTWGADLLGADVLPNGGAVSIHYTPSMYRGQCVFDIKLVEPNGAQDVVSGVNLCTITSVSFSRQDGHVVFETE